MSVYPLIFRGEFFHILTQPVPYAFVSANRRNTEVRAHIATWARASLFCRFADIQTIGYTEPVPLKYGKTRHEILVDTRIFVQCTTGLPDCLPACLSVWMLLFIRVRADTDSQPTATQQRVRPSVRPTIRCKMCGPFVR